MPIDPLVAEAMRKARSVWIQVSDEPPRLVWHLWHEEAAYVLHAGQEQQIPGLATAVTCTIAVKGDHGGQVVAWQATVETVEPGTPEWEAITPFLLAARLNLHDAADALSRWACTCHLNRLVPSST